MFGQSRHTDTQTEEKVHAEGPRLHSTLRTYDDGDNAKSEVKQLAVKKQIFSDHGFSIYLMSWLSTSV